MLFLNINEHFLSKRNRGSFSNPVAGSRAENRALDPCRVGIIGNARVKTARVKLVSLPHLKESKTCM